MTDANSKRKYLTQLYIKQNKHVMKKQIKILLCKFIQTPFHQSQMFLFASGNRKMCLFQL